MKNEILIKTDVQLIPGLQAAVAEHDQNQKRKNRETIATAWLRNLNTSKGQPKPHSQ